MPRNNNIDLQNHLFEVMESIKDGDIELEKAKSMCDVAKHIIEAKKLQHDERKLKFDMIKLIADHNGHVDESRLLEDGQ